MLRHRSLLLISLSLFALVSGAAQSEALDELGAMSLRELAFQNKLHESTWKISRAAATNLDQGAGTITW